MYGSCLDLDLNKNISVHIHIKYLLILNDSVFIEYTISFTQQPCEMELIILVLPNKEPANL